MHCTKRLFFLLLLLAATVAGAQPTTKLKKRDYRKDVKLLTTKGNLILRLHDSTPLHRDNFLKLVKAKYYNGILFHRVIKGFMAQAGDAATKRGKDTTDRLAYTLPAEILPHYYHKKGVLAAARTGDNINPERRSSGVQFYIVQGRVHTDASLDSAENFRLKRTLPSAHRTVYKSIGGSPHLDGSYTIFGELVSGFPVLDSIAATPTSKQPPDKPLKEVRIKRAKLVRRK